MTLLAQAMTDLPLVAILRGITPDDVVATGEGLVAAGFRVIEIPLTSPDPFTSIAKLVDRVGAGVIVGAGTVRTVEELNVLRDCGGRLMVTPHGDTRLIAAAKALGLYALPGVATPTEAFAALDAGADGLKMFPGEYLSPAAVKAWRTVMGATLLYPTGGITLTTMADYVAAGASGFGLGSALYGPGARAMQTEQRARSFAAVWRTIAA